MHLISHISITILACFINGLFWYCLDMYDYASLFGSLVGGFIIGFFSHKLYVED